MRLENFESPRTKPLGEGRDKKVFINPNDKKKIISETKEDVEKDTPRELKGRFYLTKIAHLLLPKNIPDVYQAGEDANGKQTMDVERISHAKGHALLQKLRQSDKDEGPAREQITKEMGAEITNLDLELERIGFAFNIDSNLGNYTKDKKGNVYYLETFKPWQVDPTNKKEIEVLFNEEDLRNTIEEIPNQKEKEKCTQYLKRLLVLLEEERQELKNLPEDHKDNSIEYASQIKEIEEMFAPFMTDEFLTSLHSIKTGEEALKNTERGTAIKARNIIFSKLKSLREETNITDEEYKKLDEKYKILDRALGVINSGVVDHTR